MNDNELQRDLDELLADATHDEMIAMLAECKRLLQVLRLAAG